MSAIGTFVLGATKSEKKAYLQRNVSATLYANNKTFNVSGIVVRMFLRYQVENNYNSISRWPQEYKTLFLETFSDYIKNGGDISSISSIIGIYSSTLEKWYYKGK